MEIFVQFTILRKSFTLTLEFKRLDGGLAEAWRRFGGGLTEGGCEFDLIVTFGAFLRQHGIYNTAYIYFISFRWAINLYDLISLVFIQFILRFFI